MKKKIGWMTLLLLCATNLALAQDATPTAAPTDTAEVQTTVQAPTQRVASKTLQRQGRDMRRCLKLKTNEAIIRCAEAGRKP